MRAVWARTLLLSALLSVAATPFELPSGEDPGPWSDAMRLSSFEPGAASGPRVWARAARAPDGTLTLEVLDEAGELRRSSGHAWPTSPEARRDLVVLARSLTRPDEELPALLLPQSLRPAPAPPPAAPRPGPAPTPAPSDPEPSTPAPEEPSQNRLLEWSTQASWEGAAVPRLDPLYPQHPLIVVGSCSVSGLDERGREAHTKRYILTEDGGPLSCDSEGLNARIEQPDQPQWQRRSRIF